MTILRLQFAGQVKKAEHKTAGNKALVELSICKKVKGRNGGEDTFTWVRVTVWDPAEFQIDKLVKGAFVAGSGDFTLRSYESKGEKGVSAEVRCTSFDIEVGDSVPQEPAEAPAERRPAGATGRAGAGAGGDDEPPF